MPRTRMTFDVETKGELDLKKVGLGVYSRHPSTHIQMCSYKFDDGRTKLWDRLWEPTPPAEMIEALLDPEVEKRAFNAQFERVMFKETMGIVIPQRSIKCSMAQAYMMSFNGQLGDIGKQVELPLEKQKIAEGKRLIKLFCNPQRITKKNPHRWRDWFTNPDEYERFGEYCVMDTESEYEIDHRLDKFEIPDEEWELYWLDQEINERGIPIDMTFVQNAIIMSNRRKLELLTEMKDKTGLDNPNSGAQLLPWLRERGYPFADLRADTIKKVLLEHEVEGPLSDLEPEAEEILILRQNASKTSVKKYDALAKAVNDDSRLRYSIQFAGAQRTLRFAGRRFQPHNLPRTPGILEIDDKNGGDENLMIATRLIREGDYEGLKLFIEEPLTALVGCLRSAVRAPEGREFRVCDLASIESCVIGWLSGCERLLNVFREGRDSYKDFATYMFGVPYDEVTKKQRTESKPPVLGGGYRLGGGTIRNGKRTGLWAYAERMGIEMTKEQAHASVKVFREMYKEIPEMWYALEKALEKALKTGHSRCGAIRFEMKRPFMICWLPNGRPMYYYKPRMVRDTMVVEDADGNEREITRHSFSYEGTDSTKQGSGWGRVSTHGGKVIENLVQAIAREILKYGMLAAAKDGFDIVFHVHDEIVTEQDIDDDEHTWERLGALMTRTLKWALGLPLGFDGWRGPIYHK